MAFFTIFACISPLPLGLYSCYAGLNYRSSMNILHYEKNFTYTDRELLQIARKIGKIATYCKRVKDEGSCIRIDAERRNTKKDRDQVKVSITIELPGKELRAESRRSDVIEAVDRCIEKLEPQVKKYKELHTSRGRAQKNKRAKRAA